MSCKLPLRICLFSLLIIVLNHAEISAESYQQKFDGQFDYQKLKLFGTDTPTNHCKLTDDGVRITFQSTKEKRIPVTGVITQFPFKGDFVATGTYEILDIPKPEEGFGAGVTMVIHEQSGKWASLQRVHHPRKGQIYVAHDAAPSQDPASNEKYKHSVAQQKASSDTGKVRLERHGTTLKYFVADGEDQPFKEIRSIEFPDGEIRDLELATQTGKSPASIDILWKEFTLEHDIQPESPEAPTPPVTSYWLWMIVAVGIVVLSVGIVWKIRS